MPDEIYRISSRELFTLSLILILEEQFYEMKEKWYRELPVIMRNFNILSMKKNSDRLVVCMKHEKNCRSPPL